MVTIVQKPNKWIANFRQVDFGYSDTSHSSIGKVHFKHYKGKNFHSPNNLGNYFINLNNYVIRKYNQSEISGKEVEGQKREIKGKREMITRRLVISKSNLHGYYIQFTAISTLILMSNKSLTLNLRNQIFSMFHIEIVFSLDCILFFKARLKDIFLFQMLSPHLRLQAQDSLVGYINHSSLLNVRICKSCESHLVRRILPWLPCLMVQ
mgnify:CR=1 FL=1